MKPVAVNEINSLRAEIASTFDTTCEIQRETETNLGNGISSTNYTTSSTVNCRVSIPTNPQEIEIAGKVVSRLVRKIRLPYDADVRASDRLKINNTIYEIVGVNSKSSPLLMKTAVCIQSS